ncbi:MAG: MCE family protein [candidate division Zixibacteria bacterium]|nr:MCE family protein [candidate division Zixibacteria bacterium]
MRDLSIEVKVGTVVVLAIAILIYSVIWVKEYQFDVEHYFYTAHFPQVGTLDVGDPVAVLGVDKGEVQEIKLTGNTVRVKMSLSSDVTLKEDAKMVVMNVGLMGERFITVWPGESETPLDLNVPIMGKYDTGIPEVMGMMGDAIDEIRSLVAQLEGTVGEKGKAEQIRQIIDALAEITANTSNFVNANQDAMADAVGDLSSAAGRMRAFLDSNSVAMEKSVNNFADASETIKELSGRIDRLSQQLEDGEGTLGKTLADDSLYYDLRSAVTNLDSLITEFKEDPKKFINLSIF